MRREEERGTRMYAGREIEEREEEGKYEDKTGRDRILEKRRKEWSSW